MDCCNTKEKKHEKTTCPGMGKLKEGSMKGGKSMVAIRKNTLMWVVIGILVIATIFLTVKASSIGTGPAQATARTAASTASSGMVGGC